MSASKDNLRTPTTDPSDRHIRPTSTAARRRLAQSTIVENNGVGINVTDGAGASFLEGSQLTVTGNGKGLVGDGAGTLTILSDPAKPSSIVDNAVVDVDLKFGTRATFQGVTIGSITCDATVLSRGTTVCP